ncbi:MAG: succinate dehydrogenase/fumarate reductase iron-sulfur subunit [Candidatus Omnitrophica bacterium]|nr:succinate dehydrogenase/fumarate reductase iron-sulfur subunit [Candidatus Omnitrophota bacterium]
MAEKTHEAVFLIFRGTPENGEYKEYRIQVVDGMVVLDAMMEIQAKFVSDLGIRCNCGAGKCGSCSAEINGVPRLMCKTRLSDLPEGQPVKVGPLKSFPGIKDLVTDVSWNYEVNKTMTPFTPHQDTEWRMQQFEVDRIQEHRKCIECFLCQDTCHVIREHDKKKEYCGPRFLVRLASLAMHPLDAADRMAFIKEKAGIGLCNVTHCCSDVCPEKIRITDNAIIPLKERIADRYYDPVLTLIRRIFGKRKSNI